MKKIKWLLFLMLLTICLAAPLASGQRVLAYPYHYIYPGETVTMENKDLEGGLSITKSWRSHSGLVSIEPLGLKPIRCLVTGVRAGGRADVTCTTKATALDGKTQNTVTHTYEFVVVPKPDSIRISNGSQAIDTAEKIWLDPSDSMTLTVGSSPDNSMFRSLQVTSSDEEILEVSYQSSTQKLTLIPKKTGEVKIRIKGNYLDDTAKYQKSESIQVLVAPNPKLTGISMRQTTKVVSLAKRDHPIPQYRDNTIYLDPVPKNAALGTVTFTSSNPSVVQIQENGTRKEFNRLTWSNDDDAYCSLRALKSGTAVITATTAEGYKATCTVTVPKEDPQKVILGQSSISLTVGSSTQLSASIDPEYAEPSTLTFTSSNPAALSVDRNGKVTATATSDFLEHITVSTANGKTASCYVRIEPKIPKTVSLDKTQLKLGVGGTYSLKLTLGPDPSSHYYWYWDSSDYSVVSVDEKGGLKALKEGTATITVYAGPSQTASCKVTVQKAESPSSTTKPVTTAPTTTPKPATTAKAAKKGTLLKSSSLTGIYKVTASGSSPKVAFLKPASAKKTSISIPASIKVNKVTYQVTSIAAGAFKGNSYIQKVVIGKNVSAIGSKAFYGCKKLNTVVIGSKVQTIGTMAFYKCPLLKKVTIGASVKTIGSMAFSGCTSLSSLILPSKVTTIGKQAFYGCKKLKILTIHTAKLTSARVGASAFKNTYAKISVKVPKGKAAAYKKILLARGLGKYAKIR